MNTLPPASVPSTPSNSSSTGASNASDSASSKTAGSDTTTTGRFHQVLNQQIAHNNGSSSDAKGGSAQAASANASANASGAASKSTKSTHSATAPQAAGSGNARGSSDVTPQQAAAISAASGQTAQSANTGDVTDSATAATAGTSALLSSQLANAELGNGAATVSASASLDAPDAGDAGTEALVADQRGAFATPGSVWGAMDGKGDSADARLYGHSGGAGIGAAFNEASGTSSHTASALLITQHAAMDSEQSLFSSAADKTRDSSGIQTAGSSDATLAAAQVSTTDVAGATPSSAGSTVASASVPYQMGSDAWRADVSSHVLYFTQQDISSAELHLNPAHLSPLNISISVDSNQTSIAFNAAHEATRQAMQDSLPQLREMFQAHGIALGQTTVGDSSAGSTRQQDHNSARSGPGNAGPASKALESSSAAVNGSSGVRVRSLQIVDTFA